MTAGGDFSTVDVEIPTLTDLTHLQGTIAEVFGQAQFNADPRLPCLDNGNSRDAMVLGGHRVNARWIEKNGVTVAIDFDSLAMFSAYAHVESAAVYFQQLGVSAAHTSVPIYYHLSIPSGADNIFPPTDNALYLRPADALVVQPMRFLQDIPFSMNPGVIAHEYSHRVFYHEAWGGQLFTLLGGCFAPTNAVNLVLAVDEGVADFFGAVLSGDPQFLQHSVFLQLAQPRDLSVPRAVDATWLNGTAPLNSQGSYTPYPLGTVLAAVLWDFAIEQGTDLVARAVLASQRRLFAQLNTELTYRVGQFAAWVIEELPSTNRLELCERAAAAYAASWESFAMTCP
ncbi:MAG: hypothetical protein R3C68_09615 [Myxococcota bacterium]